MTDQQTAKQAQRTLEDHRQAFGLGETMEVHAHLLTRGYTAKSNWGSEDYKRTSWHVGLGNTGSSLEVSRKQWPQVAAALAEMGYTIVEHQTA